MILGQLPKAKHILKLRFLPFKEVTLIAAESSEISAMQTRAVVYGFLAALFNLRPDRQFVERLRGLDLSQFVELGEDQPGSEETQKGMADIDRFIEEIKDLSDEEAEMLLAKDWTRLFRGVSPGYGPQPPYEGLYRQDDPIKSMRAVAAFYRHYGVEPTEGVANRPDYIGLELDFLRYLCVLQKEAVEEDKDPQKWQQAEQEFVERHLGAWIGAYCQKALPEAHSDFYKGVLHWIQGLFSRTEAK